MGEVGSINLESAQHKPSPVAKLKSVLSQPEKATPPVLKEAVFELAENPDLRYSQAKEALGSLILFLRDYPDRIVKKDRFRPEKIPFFDSRKVEDREYVQAYERLLRLERTQDWLNQFREKAKTNPELLEDSKKVYDFIVGADAPFKVDIERPYGKFPMILGPGDQILNGSIQMEMANSLRFKSQTIPQLGNLEQDKMAEMFGNVQLTSLASQPARTGRIYLNPRVKDTYGNSNVTAIFEYLAQDFNRYPQLFHSIKTIDFATRGTSALIGVEDAITDFLRTDKIVAYIDMEKLPQVMAYFKEFYRRIDEPVIAFDYGTPMFTEPVEFEGAFADRAIGISFAEEPPRVEGETERSRNQTVAEALRRAAKKVGIEKLDSEEFEDEVRSQFTYFKIDPENPAYNLKEDPSAIKRVPADPTAYQEYTSNFKKQRRKSA